MAEDEDGNIVKVLVTGFGAFQEVTTNPSWEIVSRLPSTINHKWLNIRIITQPKALKASYHHLFEVTPQLLEQYKPIEKGAERDSYHQYPDVDRKVFTKSEIKKAWGKSLSRIGSSLDFEDVLVKWRAQAGKDVDLRTSDDVGNYVCDFVYYTSLEYFWKRRLNTPVVFMHVPPLPEKDDIDKGVKVTLGLIRGLAESNHLY